MNRFPTPSLLLWPAGWATEVGQFHQSAQRSSGAATSTPLPPRRACSAGTGGLVKTLSASETRSACPASTNLRAKRSRASIISRKPRRHKGDPWPLEGHALVGAHLGHGTYSVATPRCSAYTHARASKHATRASWIRARCKWAIQLSSSGSTLSLAKVTTTTEEFGCIKEKADEEVGAGGTARRHRRDGEAGLNAAKLREVSCNRGLRLPLSLLPCSGKSTARCEDCGPLAAKA